MAEGDDVAGDAAAGRPDDRLVGIGDDDRVPPAQPDARPPIPGDFHRRDSHTAACACRSPRRRTESPANEDRRRLPNRRLLVRSETRITRRGRPEPQTGSVLPSVDRGRPIGQAPSGLLPMEIRATMTVPRESVTTLLTVLADRPPRRSSLVAACHSASPTPSPEPSPAAPIRRAPTASRAAVRAPRRRVAQPADPTSSRLDATTRSSRRSSHCAGCSRPKRWPARRIDEASSALSWRSSIDEDISARAGRRERAPLQVPRPAPGRREPARPQVEMLSGEVAGFYRDDEKKLYVVSRSGDVGANEKITFAHEYTHALQDQTLHDLQGPEDVTDQSDWLMARQARLRGRRLAVDDAVGRRESHARRSSDLLAAGLNDPAAAAMLERCRRSCARRCSSRTRRACRSSTGQYVSGGGWAGGRRAVRATCPASTEQVLHPEKYQAGRRPSRSTSPTTSPPRLGPGWKVALQDTFGEFQTGVWLRDAGGRERQPTAAAGWGGDRRARARRPERRVGDVVLDTDWDTAADAAAFEAAAASPLVEALDNPAALLPAATHRRAGSSSSSNDECPRRSRTPRPGRLGSAPDGLHRVGRGDPQQREGVRERDPGSRRPAPAASRSARARRVTTRASR